MLHTMTLVMALDHVVFASWREIGRKDADRTHPQRKGHLGIIHGKSLVAYTGVCVCVRASMPALECQ